MPRLVLDDDRPLAAALLVEQLDAAGDLGDDGRVLGLAGLEDLGDAGQAAGDVLRAGRPRAGVLASSVPAVIFWPFGDLDARLLGQVVEVEDLAARRPR